MTEGDLVTQDEIVRYWIETAEENFASMKRIFSADEYVWALFIGHLVIEKLLKASCAKYCGPDVPKTHDLLRLADRAGISISPKQQDLFDRLTTFQAEVRYPDIRYNLYKKADREFVRRYMEDVTELREWLLGILSK